MASEKKKTLKISFDPERHRYFINGELWPSVTQVIDEAGLYPPMPFATERHLARGRYVHRAIALDEQGRLDWDSLSESLKPYVEAWRRFKQASTWRSFFIELTVAHSLDRYAGRLDLCGCYEQDGERRNGILEIKTGSPTPAHRLQLAAYKEAYVDYFGLSRGDAHALKADLIYLRPDGSYRVEPLGSTWYVDFLVFEKAAGLWHWKYQNGLLPV